MPQDNSELSKNPHTLVIYDQLRFFLDWRALGLDMLSETSGEFEHRVLGDVRWNVFMSLFLVPDVDQPVVDTHL